MTHSILRVGWTASLVALALTSATTSRAEPMAGHEPTESRWYGAPILGMDIGAAAVGGLGVGLFYAVSTRGDYRIEPLAIMTAPAILTYLFGGPIVHWAHGHVEKGFASLALRLIPVVGSIIDIAFLSHESAERPPTVRWTPIATVDSRGFTTGFAVAF